MTFEAALRQVMLAAPAVQALVGDRVYPKVLPQDPTYPCIAYHRTTARREYSHDGPSGLATAQHQIDCFAPSHREAKLLADAVREALEGYQGEVGQVRIDYIFVDEERDEFDPDLDVFWFSLSISAMHSE